MNNLLNQLIETFHTKFNLLILSIIITLSVTYAYRIKHLLRFSIYQVLLEIITEINRLYKCKGYNPEFPVLQRPAAHVFVKHVAHLVHALPGDRDTCGWQLGLTCAAKQMSKLTGNS